MKKIYCYFALMAVLVALHACKKELPTSSYYTDDPYENYVPPVIVDHSITLKDKSGWTSDTISAGYIWYKYNGLYQTQNANQIINVLELDLNDPTYEIEFKFVDVADSLSSVALNADAIAGINGTYELDASFIKTRGVVHSQVTLPSDHLRFWKHEGAFSYSGGAGATIAYGTNTEYLNSSYPNIFSGSPMLVSNGEPVGENFIGNISGIDINSLEGEDYRRHQGVRHPRTAVAMTESGKLLLVTVDGRRSESAGMSAKEMTQFLQRYFAPKNALNIDGGGSTTMYIKGSGMSNTDVVNYPTDNGKYDHYGQRRVRSFILIKKVTPDESTFARGSGTVNDPFVITTAKHLQNMHSIDWTGANINPLYFKLEADIDMVGKNWIPINNLDPYSRHLHFDGNGHVIKNLTSKGASYASLFGVLLGSCKNLGVINATIESTNGGGIIAGYVGLKGPDGPTGTVENCFTSGIVSGRDAVGGIAGNIGKPNGAKISAVKNSFSTANVTATNQTANSRAAGIAGIVWAGGVVENCYASGKITSMGYGAGGIVGWTDTDISGCVALNPAIINKMDKSDRIGRISSAMGKVDVIAQGANCWAIDGMIVENAGTILNESQFVTGVVVTASTKYDGETKTKAFLSNINHYSLELQWPFGIGKPWSLTMNGKEQPILQWMFERGDYDDMN